MSTARLHRPTTAAPDYCLCRGDGCMVCLAATCCGLRVASVQWFCDDVFTINGHIDPGPPQHIAWLCRGAG